MAVMYVQVLACFGASDKSALLDHMSVGEAMHLIHVSLIMTAQTRQFSSRGIEITCALLC